MAKKQQNPTPSKRRSEAWATEQLADIKPADPRALRRLHAVMAGQHRSPGASIPEAMEGWAPTKAAYRLAQSGTFTDQDLLHSHREATLRRIQTTPRRQLLVIQDTTTLNYAHRPGTEGLGPIGNNHQTLGLHLHSQLCLDPENGEILGLLAAKLWARDTTARPAGARNRQPLAQKESHRWLEAYAHAHHLARQLGPATTVTSVADREGDLYEVFLHAQQAQCPAAHLLIRAQHNRAQSEHLTRSHDHVKAGRIQTTLQLKLPAQPGRPAREATLEIRHAQVRLAAPVSQKNHTEALALSLIIATEKAAPPGAEAVEWLLWSSRPVETNEDALGHLRAYAQRWQIEVLHRILKTGCKTEHRQLEKAERLKLYIAIDLLIAVYLLGLTQAARAQPQAPASSWFSPEELQTLKAMIGKADTNPNADLATAVKRLGQLGGHLGRKSDGPPGAEVLWRGLKRLRDMSAALQLLRTHPALQTCG